MAVSLKMISEMQLAWEIRQELSEPEETFSPVISSLWWKTAFYLHGHRLYL